MARPKKIGLDYFPLNTDLFDDDKILYVEGLHGHMGGYIAIRLLCKIYKTNGYWYQWGDTELSIFVRQLGGKYTADMVEEVIASLLHCRFFDPDIYRQHSILTSRGIQRRYIEAKRNTDVLRDDINLVKQKNVFAAKTTAETGISATETEKEKNPQRQKNVSATKTTTQMGVSATETGGFCSKNPPNKIKEKENKIKENKEKGGNTHACACEAPPMTDKKNADETTDTLYQKTVQQPSEKTSPKKEGFPKIDDGKMKSLVMVIWKNHYRRHYATEYIPDYRSLTNDTALIADAVLHKMPDFGLDTDNTDSVRQFVDDMFESMRAVADVWQREHWSLHTVATQFNQLYNKIYANNNTDNNPARITSDYLARKMREAGLV